MRWLALTALLLPAASLAQQPEPARPDAPARGALLDAYKREYSYLESEKEALAERLREVDAEARRREGEATRAIERLQADVVEARAKAERLAAELDAAARDTTSADDGPAVVRDTLARAQETLGKLGVAVEAQDSDAARLLALGGAFAAAAGQIAEGGRVRTEAGAFFLATGERVEGTVVRVGRVAAFGAAEQGAGPLIPAGEGRLRILPEASPAAARALAEGRSPGAIVPVFLYESLEKAIEIEKERTPLEVVRAGGPIAWVIVWLGAAAALIVVLRALLLAVHSTATGRLLRRIGPSVAAGRLDEAQRLARRSTGAAARVVRATLAHLRRDREVLENVIAEAVLHEAPRLSRFASLLTVMAAVAPLLGLLGTVTGMISTFDIITEHGTGDPKLLSGGISEALITTELGLMVAIPTLLLGTLLTGLAGAIQRSVERAALRVVNLSDTHELEEAAAPASAPLATLREATE